MSLRIAYLTSEYPALSHTFIYREVCSLRDEGFEIHTASISAPSHLDRMTEAERAESRSTLNIKQRPLVRILADHAAILLRRPFRYLRMLGYALSRGRRGPGSIFMGIAYFVEAGILLRWMHQRRLEHVHVHFGNPSATVAMIAAAYGTVSFSISIHGADVFEHRSRYLLGEKMRSAAAVRCISHYSQSQLWMHLPFDEWDKVKIVRCGVDPDLFRPVPGESGDAVPEILCVGRLVPAKGQHVLIEAMALLRDRGVRFRAVLLGGGSDQSSLRDLTRRRSLDEYVTFGGPVGQPVVREHLDRADIFVLASFAEGVPVVLMEAMAQEIPVVSTWITGIPELIEDGKEGFLVTPADAYELADRLQDLAKDPALRQRMGKHGREKVVSHYHLGRNCQQMGEFFRSFLDGGDAA